MLTLEEWELLLQASDRVQRPILRTALGLTSLFAAESADKLAALRDHILAQCLLFLLMDAENPTAANSRIGGLLNVYELDGMPNNAITSRLSVNYGKFDERGLNWVETELKKLLLPEAEIPSYKNRAFRFSDLTTALEMAILYEESHGNRRVRDNCSTLLTRVKSLGRRDEFSFLRGNLPDSGSDAVTAEAFIDVVLGINRDSGVVS